MIPEFDNGADILQPAIKGPAELSDELRMQEVCGGAEPDVLGIADFVDCVDEVV